MSALFVARGNCTLGRIQKDADGNVVKQTPAQFETDPAGGCVAICEMDPDTMKPTSGAEIFGDWDAAGFLKKILEKLGPGRKTNLPDLLKIVRKAKREDGVDICETLCEYCEDCGYACRDCIITAWKEEDDGAD